MSGRNISPCATTAIYPMFKNRTAFINLLTILPMSESLYDKT